MRILYVTPRQCLPATSGAKLRDYYLARALGEQSDLTYIYTADPDSEPLQARDMPFCRELVAVPKAAGYTPAKVVRGLVGRIPLPVLNYSSPSMQRAVARAAAAGAYDLAHFDSVHVSGCARALGPDGFRPPVVWNWHNIESELMSRFAAQVDSRPKRLYALKTARQLAELERSILATAAGHIVCSEREHARLHAIAPDARIAVIENGVDGSRFERIRHEPPARIVLVGAMNYHANVEAAIWFARSVWPGVRARYPYLRLTIVGASPSEEVVQLGEAPGIDVTGTVPDVRPYYAEAAAAIVPLRVGGGTRLKILEAMAAGVPVVSSEVGAEGLGVTPGRDILIAESPELWHRHIAALVEQPELRPRLVEAGRFLVRTRYDWRIIGDLLTSTYRNWFETVARV